MEEQDTKNEIVLLEEQLPDTSEECKKIFQNAVSFYEKRDFQQASTLFKQITEQFPDKVEAYINYADCQFELSNQDEAVKYWDLAKEKNPFLLNPYVNLGNYYLSKDDLTKAKDEFEAAFCIDPYNENLIVNLGITNERIGNRKMAFMLYEFFMNNSFNVTSALYRNVHKKVSMHKLNAISHMKLGVFFETKHFYRKALQSFYESLRVFPNFSKTYMNIGNIFFKFEKYDFAFLYWLEAYKIEKKKPKLCLNLALCAEKLDRKIDAYCFFSYFIQITSGGKEILTARKKAQHFKSEVSQDYEIVKAYRAKAEEYINKKEFDTAIIMFENLYFLTKNNEFFKKLNELLATTNIINKAAKKTIEFANFCNEQKDYDKAVEKAKIARKLWDNTEIDMAANDILSYAQNQLNMNLDNLVKQRMLEEEQRLKEEQEHKKHKR